MIKKYSLVFIALLCSFFYGFGQSDVIISQYIETNSGTTPKGIEVFNVTGADIIFSITNNLQVYQGTNGSSCGAIVNITSGTLAYNEVWVIGTTDLVNYANSNGTGLSGTTDYSFSFNGDDALVLRLGGTLQDQFGFCGNDPGSAWTGGGVSTTNNNLQIKDGLCNGDVNGWTDPSERFDQITDGSTMTGFGNAPTSCSSTDEVDYCNLQSPSSGSITSPGVTYNVYAQVYEPGVTDSVGQGANIVSEIGYSTSNTDPSTWTNWVNASYNTDSGNNDEYTANIGVGLTSGTYYYASRFTYNGGPYKYGGINLDGSAGGGFWNGTNFISGVLSVIPDQVDFCNIEYPKTATITTGSNFNVYAQVYEPGITDSAGQGANILAWIGYNTIGINHEPWVDGGSDWTWIPATYNASCLDCNGLQNDEYFIDIGCGLPTGDYYYASRFQLNGSDYSYGGITSDNVGNFWTLNTINSGTLTVTDAPLADVVITEIMYNTIGTDDEWIEICNVSGSTQDISNYIIDVGGSTQFAFPCNTAVPAGTCITIALGDNGTAPFNPDCDFTPDFGSPITTDVLSNTTSFITLFSANGTTPADIVTYDSSDGGDGNGSSLHIIDISQDNSNTSSNWQEVDYGGSSGANTLIPNCLPAGIEINVEGNLGNYPDITDGDISPSGIDNTLFAAQFIGSSQGKSYRIQSLFATDVIISNITITGDSGDFSITGTPASPVTYGTPSILEITFSPIAIGQRTAVVHIFNNDSNESEYTFTIQGDGLCVTNANTITPTSGPEGTIVTVTGSDLDTATASFNGLPANVTYISDTMMEVVVPSGAATGNLEIVDDLTCTSLIPFTIIDSQIGSCEGGSALTEIFISEVTDATYGGLTYIELYNPTTNDINLSNYSIDVYNNGNTDTSDTNLYKSQSLSGTILAGQTFTVSTGYSGSSNCDSQPGGDGSYSDFDSIILGGINKKDNEHDFVGLYKSGIGLIDAFGGFGDNVWMDALHTAVTGDRGFNFRRLNTATPLPQSVFNNNDWAIIDWAGTGSGSCSTNDYSNIDTYDFSTGTPPTLASGPTINYSCNTATISVSGIEGYSGGNSLAYQWYYSAPGELGWTEVPDDVTYNDVTTGTLEIVDTSSLEGYQYYCQVREDDANCFKASNAVQLTLSTTTWTSTGWSASPPNSSSITIIDYTYDTGTNGDIDACSLIIKAGNTLSISNSTHVNVVNNVLNNGTIDIQTQGSFVQQGDGVAAGTFTNSGAGIATVHKNTATFNSNISEINYTYWSTPVNDPSNSGFGEDISTVFPTPVGNRKFYFMAQNYIDSFKEDSNNNDNTTNGQDDIDDNGNDWTTASGALEIGRGYAITTSGLPPSPGNYSDNSTVFSGALNTGDITVTLYKNNNEINDNNWNFIGNPYPSAISVDDFFSVNIADVTLNVPVNGQTLGAIFLWSQSQGHDPGNNGNENWNFAQSDYAIINRVAATAGTSGILPSRYIPSGQGFFVALTENLGASVNSITSDNVVFKNSMRRTLNNTQFFEVNDGSNDSKNTASKSSNEKNILWLNMASDNGAFSQIAIAYANGATDGYDGWSYDTPRNLSTGTYATHYSVIEALDKQFAIQGKSLESLTLNEIIPIGFSTSISEATLYKFSLAQIEGSFLNQNDIFIKDLMLNKTYNLKESDYSFTSSVGEFNDRFEIVFTRETLGIDEVNIDDNALQIIELQNGDVQFKVSSQYEMKSVEIIDLLGRTIYKFNAEGSSQIFSLSNLSQATYLAKVMLTNGHEITKKALKRK